MNLPLPLLLIAISIRTAIILVVLVVGIRIFGKRDIGQLNIIDVVTVLLLGNAVQNAITHGSGVLWVGIVSAGTLLLIDRLTGRLFVRNPLLESSLSGNPVVILTDGKPDQQKMKKEGVTMDELKGAIRLSDLESIRQVHLAILEPDGTISIIPNEDQEQEGK